MTKAWPVCEFCVPVSELEDMLLHPAARNAAREKHPRRADLTGRLRNIESHLFLRTITTYAEQAPSGQGNCLSPVRTWPVRGVEGTHTGGAGRALDRASPYGESFWSSTGSNRKAESYRLRLRAWLPLILPCGCYRFGGRSSRAANHSKHNVSAKVAQSVRKFFRRGWACGRRCAQARL